ncbi:MAG TPA: hypothetical protein VL595_15190 [Pseudonocardia sp.]|nr:hypothetical protein [Pseudonocardia sp.]
MTLSEAPVHAVPAQVFVDDSGRRRRLIRRGAAALAAACVAFIAVVGLGLSQTGVGMVSVPGEGNGLVAGFDAGAGQTPGLLSPGGVVATTTKPITPLRRTLTRRPTAKVVGPTLPAVKVPTSKPSSTTKATTTKPSTTKSSTTKETTTTKEPTSTKETTTKETTTTKPPATSGSRSGSSDVA